MAENVLVEAGLARVSDEAAIAEEYDVVAAAILGVECEVKLFAVQKRVQWNQCGFMLQGFIVWEFSELC